MAVWSVPVEMGGNPRLLRVYAGAVRDKDDDCPMARAISARPALKPRVPVPSKASALIAFPLKLVMDVLDLVEFDGLDIASAFSVIRGLEPHRTTSRRRSRNAHAGVLRWAEHAVDAIRRARKEANDNLQPVRQTWIEQWDRRDRPDQTLYELCAWGRRYASADGMCRELWLPVMGVAGSRERALGEVELAAHVVAFAGLVDEPAFGRAHDVRSAPRPQRVRLVEVSCLDGKPHILFDGVPEDTQEPYRRLAAPRLRDAVDGTARRPGPSCLKCHLAPTCPALVSTPGLLGVDDTTRPRRTVSITDLRRYDECPAKEHLRRLRLPVDFEREHNDPVRRGHAVHEWLRQQHRRTPARSCTAMAADLPADRTAWSAGQWSLVGRDAELGADLIRKHAAVCPLRYASDGTSLRHEETLGFLDTAADVVVLATPDLLYRSGDSWIWREVKTTKYIRGRGKLDILEQYPQAALALLLLAEGALGGDPSGSRVELEILRPSGPDLELIDPNDPARVATARDVIHGLARKWHSDGEFRPAPGPECATCEVARWCPDRLDPTTDEAGGLRAG